MTLAVIRSALLAATGLCVSSGAACAGNDVYVVHAGDTVFAVARQHHVGPRGLAEYNHLSSPYKLAIGQKVRIPLRANVAASTPALREDETSVVVTYATAYGAAGAPVAIERSPSAGWAANAIEPSAELRNALVAAKPALRFADALAPSAPPPATIRLASADVDRPKPVGEKELSQMRGGYFLANGAQFDFGANISTLVNGQLALQTSLKWTADGAVIQQVTGDTVHSTTISGAELTKMVAGLNNAVSSGVVVTGPTGRTEVIANLSAGQIQNLLVNTASGQTIVQNTDVQLTIYNFTAWQQQIARQTVASRLANDARSAAALGGGH